MALPLSPSLLFLPSSNSHSPNSLLAFSSSPTSLTFCSYQRNKRTVFQQQCACTASSSSVGSLATAVSEEEDEEPEERPTEPRTRLIAQNIPWTCTAEEIKTLFERHGTVLDVELSMHNNLKNRGLAFITMSSEEEALLALSNLNSHDFNGRVIKVDFARSLKRNPHQETTVSSPPTSTCNVFVGNLAWKVRSRDLRELFSTTGKLISADVIYQSSPRRSAGYGFVSFNTKEEAEAAIAAHNEKELMGRKIRLVIGKPQADNTERKPVDDKPAIRTTEDPVP